MILPVSYSNGFAPRDGSPLYPELWRDCVGAWAPCLGPTGLTLRDWSKLGKHGALTNMSAGDDWVLRHGYYALDLDGANDIVTVKRLASPRPITISARVTLSGFRTTSTIYCNDHIPPASAPELLFGINQVSGSTHRLGLFSGAWVYGTNVELDLITDHYYAVTWSSSGAVSFYLDGIPAGTASLAVGGNAASNGVWGAFNEVSFPTFNLYGSIDDMRLYDMIIAPKEIKHLAARPGIAYEMAPRRRSRAAVITSGFSALRPSILRGSR